MDSKLCVAIIVGDVGVDVLKAGGPSRKLGCSAFSNEALKSFMTARISVR